MSSSFTARINACISEVLLERTSFIQEILNRKVLLLVPFLDFFFCHWWGPKKIFRAFGEETHYKETTDVQLSGGMHPDYIGSKSQACAFRSCYYSILLHPCPQLKTCL